MAGEDETEDADPRLPAEPYAKSARLLCLRASAVRGCMVRW